MRSTRYNAKFIVRLTKWANILAWLNLGLGVVVGVAWLILAVNTFRHPEAFKDFLQLPGTIGYADEVVRQTVRGVQTVASGLVGFVFLKAISQGLLILVDFEENTRPQAGQTTGNPT